MLQTGKKSQKHKTNVLIVDDHPVARQGLAQLINQEPDLRVCAAVENAAQALDAINSCKPGLAIVDISLKEGSGLELVKNIKTQFKGLPMLVFSMHEESLCAERALEAGARGYVMKQVPTETIIVAIRRVLDGDIYLSEPMTSRLLKKPRGAQGEAMLSPIDALSNREFEVFGLIGRGKRTVEIAEILHLSTKTVETHRAHITKKLHMNGGYEMARYAFQWSNSGG